MKNSRFGTVLKVISAVLFALSVILYAMWFPKDRGVTRYSRDTVREVLPTAVERQTDAGVSPIPAEESRADESPPQPVIIDINSAGVDELKTLPGIGDAKASAVVAYREANGGFAAKEDIMLVPGIKNGIYEKIKDLIRVGGTEESDNRE